MWDYIKQRVTIDWEFMVEFWWLYPVIILGVGIVLWLSSRNNK